MSASCDLVSSETLVSKSLRCCSLRSRKARCLCGCEHGILGYSNMAYAALFCAFLLFCCGVKLSFSSLLLLRSLWSPVPLPSCRNSMPSLPKPPSTLPITFMGAAVESMSAEVGTKGGEKRKLSNEFCEKNEVSMASCRWHKATCQQ